MSISSTVVIRTSLHADRLPRSGPPLSKPSSHAREGMGGGSVTDTMLLGEVLGPLGRIEPEHAQFSLTATTHAFTLNNSARDMWHCQEFAAQATRAAVIKTHIATNRPNQKFSTRLVIMPLLFMLHRFKSRRTATAIKATTKINRMTSRCSSATAVPFASSRVGAFS